jgi:phytol kinase
MLPALLALFLTFLLALLWLRLNDFAAHRGWISSDLSRKLIHIGTGPIFVLCWLLFPSQPGAGFTGSIDRYLAALVPLAFTIQFFLVGTGVIKDEASVKAMSRSGDRREILRGPLFYGIVFVVLTILYWKDSPIGMVALMLMCGGDGLADVLGRRYGRIGLPWNTRKSWVGSLGMLLGGWIFSAAILAVYIAAGVFPGPWVSYLPAISLIAIAGTLVESFPLEDVDNITITLVAVFLGHFLF